LLTLTVQPDNPAIAPTGIRATEAFILAPGETLVLSPLENGRLSAVVGFQERADQFTNLDGSTPAILPEVPVGRSEWQFRAQSGLFDLSGFDDQNTFDLPTFEVEISWLRYEPLTFTVHVPYFLQEAVDNLIQQHRYPGSLFLFDGLPREALAEVVNQTRAAGVQGSVQFSLNFSEVHQQGEQVNLLGQHALVEDAQVTEALTVTSVNDVREQHAMNETLLIGAVFDISPFDQGHGFVE
jgi:hypothetical protein